MLPHKILLHSIAITLAVATNINLTEVLSQLPKCSIPCLAASLTPEMLANLAVTCNNATLQTSLYQCITPVCTGEELTRVSVSNRKLCEGVYIPTKIRQIDITLFTLTTLALAAIGVRFYSRYAITKEIGYDDGLLAVAGLFIIAILAIGFYNGHSNGFGRHFWDIDPYKTGALLKGLYVVEILYTIVIAIVKVSIVMFYLRVFVSRLFRISCYILLAAIVGSSLAIVFLLIFQCHPVSGAWDLSSLADRNKCMDLNVVIYAASFVGLGLDVAILALPIPSCLALKMRLKKKLNVLFIFAFGTFATITSLIRLQFIGSFGKSADPTWDNSLPAIWSAIEVAGVAAICACLPSFRPLLARQFPRAFDISSDPSQSQHGHQQSSRSVYRRQPSYTRQNSARSSFIEQPSMREYSPVQAQRVGPMYNKRIIISPDDLILRDLDEEDVEFVVGKENEAWEKAQFHEYMKVFSPAESELPQNMAGNMHPRDAKTHTSMSSLQSPSSTFEQQGGGEETEIKVGMTFTPSMIANKRSPTPPRGYPIGTVL